MSKKKRKQKQIETKQRTKPVEQHCDSKKPQHRKALVLNADYTPLGLIGWQRGIVLSMMNQDNPANGLEVIDFYKDDFIQGSTRKYPMPAVVRCPKYIRQNRNKIPFSRKNVFIRDQLTCQYCGKLEHTSELTYDHVIPRAVWKRNHYKGTPTNWTNIVTCCILCNRKKADRTPKQAGMKLLRPVKELNPAQFILGISPWMQIPEEWVPYLTPIYKHLLNRNKS